MASDWRLAPLQLPIHGPPSEASAWFEAKYSRPEQISLLRLCRQIGRNLNLPLESVSHN